MLRAGVFDPTTRFQLTRFSRVLLVAIAAAFLVLVSLRIHGFSLPMWHQVLDASEAKEVLLGDPRLIRADDWLVQLPMAFAQATHNPPFPVVNENIGEGQNMLVPFGLPVAHPLTLFRPTMWGFFLGNDIGLAWMWWTQTLGLFVVWFLVFLVVTEGRSTLASVGAMAILASPFFNFWSFNAAPAVSFSGLCLLAVLGMLWSTRPWSILASGVLLGWAGTGLVLVMYPPFQVPLGYLVLALLAGLILDRRRELDLGSRCGLRVLGFALAGGIALAAGVCLFVEAEGAVHLMLGSTYPGARVSMGGDMLPWQLFAHDLWIGCWLDEKDYRPLLNICEAAGFWLMFPVVAVGLAREALGGPARRRADAVSIALLIYVVGLSTYMLLGVPEWLAHATLMSSVPARRAVLGLGLADMLLLLRFLSREHGAPASASLKLSAALFWSAGLAACAWFLGRAVPQLDLRLMLAMAGLNGVLAVLVLSRRGPLAVSAMAVGLGVCGLWFNPLVVGGSGYLFTNPLSRKIVQIDRSEGGKTVWLAYGSYFQPNLFRILGVSSVNGVHALPQLDLWRRIDPGGEHEELYNRYAHIKARLGRSGEVSFVLDPPDGLEIVVHPAGDAIRRLGVTHIMVTSRGPSRLEPIAGLDWIGSFGSNHLYRIADGK